MNALIMILSVIGILAVIFLILITPRITDKPDMSLFDRKLFAHRGLHDNAGDAPENSMKAFRKAIDAGYGIETDVQLTRDGIPVIFHDFTLKRICGVEGKVCDYTYDELQKFNLASSQEKIPTFADFLKLIDGRVPLIIEYKIEATDIHVCELCDPMLREYHGKYCIESFSPMGVKWYKDHHPDIVRGQLSQMFFRHGTKNPHGKLGFFMWLIEHQMLNFKTRPDFIAYDWHDYKLPSRCLCHTLFGGRAAAWTIKSQDELERMQGHFDVFIFDSFIPDESAVR
jgi:glycerophosphoryl diester phosphodiesterase